MTDEATRAKWIPAPSKLDEPLKVILARVPWTQRIYHWYLHQVTDCYIISYPKSGRTWLRAMLAKSIALHCGYQKEYVHDPFRVVREGNLSAPVIRFDHVGPDHPPSNGGEYGKFRRKRVVFLARDPRDVLVSYYFARTRRQGEDYDMSTFLRHPWWGIDRIIGYMNGWIENQSVPEDFLLVKYEDMHEDAGGELGKVLAFAGLEDVEPSTIEVAVDYGSFDNLRKLSLSKLNHVQILRPKDEGDPESYKFRKGEVGGHDDYLSDDDAAFLDEKISSELNEAFGYGR